MASPSKPAMGQVDSVAASMPKVSPVRKQPIAPRSPKSPFGPCVDIDPNSAGTARSETMPRVLRGIGSPWALHSSHWQTNSPTEQIKQIMLPFGQLHFPTEPLDQVWPREPASSLSRGKV